MEIKTQIAKFILVAGFLIYLGDYGFSLVTFYSGEMIEVALVIEDAEDKSESNENENSEKEDFKEKEKITQEFHENRAASIEKEIGFFPDFCFYCLSVYLEYITPPPEYS